MSLIVDIVTYPAATIHLSQELALVKPALLYADHVTLTSYNAAVLTELAQLEKLSRSDRVLATIQTLSLIEVNGRNLQAERIQQLYEFINTDRTTRRQWPDETKALWKKLWKEWKQYEIQLLSDWQEKLIPRMRQQYEESFAPDLLPAYRAGLLTLRPLTADGSNWSTKALTNTFFTTLQAVLDDPQSFPLFDDEMHRMVRLGLDEGKFSIAPTAQTHAAEAATAAAFMGALPSFPHATVKDILDIRRDLQKPLIRFRSAVAEISGELKAEPFSADFSVHVEDMRRNKVEPALLEIEDAIRSNNDLRELISRTLGGSEKGFTHALLTSAIALVMASKSDLLDFAIGSAAVGWSITSALRAQKKEAERIGGHKLFFLHRTEELLRQRRPTG